MSEIQSAVSPFDRIRRVDERGEYWSARELMPVMGYANWREFGDAIDRAKLTARNTGADVTSLFGGAPKKATGGRPAEDLRLVRYAAYLVAMNGDPRKPEIAAAQTYFAVRTREAELTEVAIPRQLPRSFAEALRELATEVEAREIAEQRIAELEPRAHSWDVLASADGDWSVADAAKILARDADIRTGERRLFGFLAHLGWIYRQRADNRWRIYQHAIDRGVLMPLPQTHYHPRTGDLVTDPPQVRVTAKGLNELHRRLAGTSAIPQLELEGADQ